MNLLLVVRAIDSCCQLVCSSCLIGGKKPHMFNVYIKRALKCQNYHISETKRTLLAWTIQDFDNDFFKGSFNLKLIHFSPLYIVVKDSYKVVFIDDYLPTFRTSHIKRIQWQQMEGNINIFICQNGFWCDFMQCVCT